MGNYERTLDRISQLEDELKKTDDAEDRAMIEISIGECKSYLEELANMDGYNSYCEMEEIEARY